ncbi:hypothetical protein Tco_0268738 [Tanacetum coccineum]
MSSYTTVFHMAQQIIPAAQLVPNYQSIGRCNNYTVLQISKVPDTKDTIKFKLDTQVITYTMDMFRDTLHLPVENPNNPFVAPVNSEVIESFMQRVGYQGVVDKMKSNLQNHANDPALWDVLKRKFEKSCSDDDFHSQRHDDHQEDDAPPRGKKRVKRHKTSKKWDAWEEETVIDEDENGNTIEMNIFLHPTSTRTFTEDELKKEESLGSQKLVRIPADQLYGLDFMEQIIVIRENDKPDSFSEADFKYLNKIDIEDFISAGTSRFMKESVESESFKSSAQHSVNDFVVINIPEEDVEPKQIILDPDDQPMWESAKTVAPTPNSAIIQLDVDNNFIINSTT